jgi:proteasome inhibitor subunit 1 (PI31)
MQVTTFFKIDLAWVCCFVLLGAVPPGARFDPFGPIQNIPPVRGPRPRGGGFGDPDFDHLRPPGSDDMFM